MAEHQNVLTDLASDVWVEEYHLTAGDGPQLSGAKNWSIHKRTMRGGPSDGMDVVTVNNGALSFQILPTRGMGLWRGDYRGLALGWDSPVKFPVHPSLVNLAARQGLGWLDGFNEWMCRCGLLSLGGPGMDVVELPDGTRSETPVTIHGKIANTPAHHVSVRVADEGAGTIAVRGVVDEASLFGPKLRLDSEIRTKAGGNSLTVVDQVTNFGDEAGEMQLMYHTNLGTPLLQEGARICAAADQIAPYDALSAAEIEKWDQYPGPTPGAVQQCYFLQPAADGQGQSAVMLRNAAGSQGICLSFNVRQLPCLTLWKNMAGSNDGYVTGLEPGTSYPNLKSFERQQGRVVRLAPHETYRAELAVTVLGDAESVRQTEQHIQHLQADCAPRLHREVPPEFAPPPA